MQPRAVLGQRGGVDTLEHRATRLRRRPRRGSSRVARAEAPRRDDLRDGDVLAGVEPLPHLLRDLVHGPILHRITGTRPARRRDVGPHLSTARCRGPSASVRCRCAADRLARFPVKSCRGESLDTATVEPWGLAGDRRWLVVDGEGAQVTARELPRMLLVTPTTRPDDGGCSLTAPDASPLEVDVPVDGPPADVSVFGTRA